jgi:uncharacterized protein YceH (UPF0502 family)
MQTLTPHEARVLGVLIEKAQTTPSQYPITLNALVAGCNQKSNREPILNLDEDQVLAALDGLRRKQFVREVHMTGSRVSKFRHVARETLDVQTPELVVLAELMLRGPQTIGELRTRASRMHPLESLEVVESVCAGLTGREQPLVRKLRPAPGSRAPRYAQLLAPDAHPIDPSSGHPAAEPSTSGTESAGAPAGPAPAGPAPPPGDGQIEAMLERLQKVESDLARLTQAVQRFAEELGLSLPPETSESAEPADPDASGRSDA